MRRTNKKKNSSVIYHVIFLFGFLCLLYPLISHVYYSHRANQEISRFETAVNTLDDIELRERFELAQAYNGTLDPAKMVDPYFTDKEKKGIAEYARMLEINEQLGYVDIPTIGTKLPIYAGTTERVLQKGTGHLEGTSLPIGGASTHTVITAHRGLPEANLFTDLDKVKEGQVFYIRTIFDTLAYEVDQIVVVNPSDFSKVQVEKDQDYATLLTCTPYMVNSHRLLVRGHRIPYDASETRFEKPAIFWGQRLVEFLLFFLIFLAILAVILYHQKRKKRS
ncbi:class C sortase [Streptococcus ovuberis]|uniref:Class C sortase n=1 Tax=Streptococcus ovuberis TaxID=1936207 RepID=A0A7X6MY74_9STRE|nr:class C sortase [Streptococcus ovuberis]NKZ19943.1 class C sortase [Streptococcus ovuberis]